MLWALPLVILVSALHQALAAPAGPVPRGLSALTVIGFWGLEAIALTALFLLLSERGGSFVVSGLLTGWTAWLFRGPVAILSSATAGLPPRPGDWSFSLRALALYSATGLVLAAAAWASSLRRTIEKKEP